MDYQLELGDHLAVDRGIYKHHGIYVGDGNVVAFLSTGVTEYPLEDFIEGDDLYVINHDDAKFDRETIVQRARDRLGEQGYNLVTNNCEHFANKCITDEEKSYQVRTVLVSATAVLAALTLAPKILRPAAAIGSAALATALTSTTATAATTATTTAVATGVAGAAGTAGALGAASSLIPPVAAVAATVAGAAAVGSLLASDKPIEDVISDAVSDVGDFASNAIDSVGAVASDVVVGALDTFISGGDAVVGTLDGALDTVGDSISDGASAVGDFISSLFD